MTIREKEEAGEARSLSLTEEFKSFRVGQEVFYSGITTHGKKVESKPATVSLVGFCVFLTLKSAPVEGLLPEQASVSVGEFVSGEKRITPAHC